MTGIDELRRTLDSHAHDLHDDHLAGRAADVRTRVRHVRRQRAAGVGVAAVLAVTAAGVLPMLDDGHPPAPADRQLIGKVAPATMTSLGYTYHFAEGVESGDKPARVTLRAADEPRLVTWATDGDRVRVEANVEGYSTTSTATEFEDFVFVPGPESPRFTIHAGGADTAIAVYELGDERPPGVTVDGITFREQVADQTLIDAEIGDVGDSDVTLEFTAPDAGLRLAELCRGAPRGHWINVEVGQEGPSASSDCSDDSPDAGTGSAIWFDAGDLEAGERLRVRTWVSRRFNGPPVELPDVRLGLGAYELAEPAEEAGTWGLPWRYEYAGHLWEYTGSSGGSLPGTVGGTAPEDAGLARVAIDAKGDTRYRTRVAGQLVSLSSTVGSSLEDVPLRGGDTISVQVPGDARGSVTIAYYRRAD